MGKVISIIMRCGGTSKTTTTQLLGIGLARKGFKVLLIDLDSQGNLSDNLDYNKSNPTIYDLLQGQTKVQDAIQHLKDIDLISYSSDLAFISMDQQKSASLKKNLDAIKKDYDFILIDTPPSLNAITLDAIMNSDELILPIQCDKKSIKAIMQINEELKAINNPNIKIGGILLARTKINLNGTKLVRSLLDDIATMCNTKVYKTIIRECTKIRDSDSQGLCVYDYAPKSNATTDYLAFTDEFIENEKGR